MMDNVQIGNLIIFLAQDKEDGIEELEKFAGPVPVRDVDCHNSFWIQRIVHWLTTQIVFEPPAMFESLRKGIKKNRK